LVEIGRISGCCVIRLEVPVVAYPFATLDAKIKSITKGLQSWSDKNVGHWPGKYSIGWKLLMTSVTSQRGNHGSGTTSRNIVLLSPLSSG
jgi:hypothetical protein